MSTWLDAYIDGELAPADAARLEAHASTCQACAASVEERRALRQSVRRPALYRPASDSLRAAVTAGIPAAPRRMRAPTWAYAALAASLLLALALAFQVVRAASSEDTTVREAVSSHIRSLMAAHLADITSTDQHNVKPWFAGKLDFSPRVVDHAAEGFPLTGGRLDYISGRPVAAVVYARRAHIINLFTCPDARASAMKSTQDRGYNTVTWSDGAMRFCAVSDVAPEDLMTFAQLVQGESTKP